MIKFKSVAIKNFQSVGNVTQIVKLDNDGLNLILGENLDQELDYRNGTGKSTLAQAICFALYGISLSNVKKDNLVNKINGKNMLVSLDFEIGDTKYRIERGRKPAILRFYVNNNKVDDGEDNEAKGENKNTQLEIEKVIGISYRLYRQIVSMSSKTTPFLSLRDGEQREIIEELLGITVLSKKAELLSQRLKDTKESIRDEEVRLKTIKESNEKINSHITDLRFKSNLWEKTNDKNLNKLKVDIDSLKNIDIELEIKNHGIYSDISSIKAAIKNLSYDIQNISKNINTYNSLMDKAKDKLEHAQNHSCPECHQEIHSNQIDEIKSKLYKEIDGYEKELNELDNKLGEKVDSLKLLQDTRETLGEEPMLIYSSLNEAYNHQRLLDSLELEYKNLENNQNPYIDQIANLNDSGIQEINFDFLNEQILLKDHQEFLFKLLTKKDSFIRKKIIDQNLSFLNNRLNQYLDTMNLPHIVTFNSDLSVDITRLGKDYDFEQLSSGEQNRLILSLSWAFRDIWETFNQTINLYIIDELVDSGMDKQGVTKALEILRKFILERDKNILLISHKGDIESKVDNILMATKENDFTTYNFKDE